MEALYAFARSADDIADEGQAPAAERIAALDRYDAMLDRIDAGAAVEGGFWPRLSLAIREHALPTTLLRALLSAFRQDTHVTRYPTFEELRDYCRRSADPVGRLMLHLFRATDERSLRESDAICTALQLINFWQDVAVDWAKGRVYLPQEDLARYGVDDAQIAAGRVDDAWRALMRFETGRARALMLSGAPLALRLPGRIGWELRLVVQGGLRILERIDACDGDVFRHRPVLGWRDWIAIAWRALRMRGLRAVAAPGDRAAGT